jgi:hypothetical protein
MELEEEQLNLAWKKTKRDLSHYMNSFVSRPYITDILDAKQEEWISSLQDRMITSLRRIQGDCESQAERYEAHKARIIDVPKGDYHLRPASVLHIEDAVVYAALILELYDEIRESIKWSAEENRFSHILYESEKNKKENRWQKFEKDAWNSMQKTKIDLAKEYSFVVETDVAGFYENIDLQLAMWTLKHRAPEKDGVIELLWRLLDKWAGTRKRGIPQGYGSSDIIAEAYLDSIDRRLNNKNIKHIRYNDDFFIFCKSKNGAIEAQNKLEILLRRKGLNMKSGKTKIREGDEALSDYEEPESVFRELKAESEDEFDGETKERDIKSPKSDPYGAEEKTATDGGGVKDGSGEATIDVDNLERAYKEYIKNADEVDIHLFRYIINHLGHARSPIAVDYCQRYIRDGEADVRRIIYNYFNDLNTDSEIADELAEDIRKGNIRYPYHKYVIIRWIYEEGFQSENILRMAREILSEERHGIMEIRDYATSLLAEHGDIGDVKMLQDTYSEEMHSLSQAITVYALRNLQADMRGDFYQRVNDSTEIVRYAVEVGKSKSE